LTNDNKTNGDGGQATRKPTTAAGGVVSAPVLGWGERASGFVDETGHTPVPEGGEATALVSAGLGVDAYERFKELLIRDVVRCVSTEVFSAGSMNGSALCAYALSAAGSHATGGTLVVPVTGAGSAEMVARLLDCDETIGEGLVVLVPDVSPGGIVQEGARAGEVWARRVSALCGRVVAAGGVVVSMPAGWQEWRIHLASYVAAGQGVVGYHGERSGVYEALQYATRGLGVPVFAVKSYADRGRAGVDVLCRWYEGANVRSFTQSVCVSRAGVDDVVEGLRCEDDGALYHEAIVFRLRRNECRRAAKKYKGLPVEERVSAGFGVPRPGEEREWRLSSEFSSVK
jgi:hypothetical protein